MFEFGRLHADVTERARSEEEDRDRRNRNRMIAEMADTPIDIYYARHPVEVTAASEVDIIDPDKLIGA